MRTYLLCIALINFTSSSAFADTVHLTSGKTYRGKIYQETDADVSLVVDSAAGITSIPIPRKDIKAIEKEDGGQDLLLTYSKFVRAYSEGDRHFNGGSYYKAIEFYKQAVELNPNVYASYYNIGMAYSKLGLRNEARQNLQKSIDIARAINEHGQNEKDFIAQASTQLCKLGE